MKKKLLDLLGKVIVIVGFVMIVGTAGASDNGAIETLGALVVQLIISVAVVAAGFALFRVAKGVR